MPVRDGESVTEALQRRNEMVLSGGPTTRSRHRFLPFCIQSFALRRGHPRLKYAFDRAMREEVGWTRPRARVKSRQTGRSQGGHLQFCGPLDRSTQNVRLEFHQEIVDAGSAIYLQFA